MVENEHVRPLAPSPEEHSTDDEETAAQLKAAANRKRRCIKCCACVAAVLLVEAIVLIILIFTVFKVKDPIIRTNSVTVNTLNFVNGTNSPRPGSNMSITADVSVKNPNYASFKYKNTTTTLYYHGSVVGEARGPPGKAKARRTIRMNITVDIMTDKILSNPIFSTDLSSGLLTLNSFTSVGGRVKILKIIKRHVTVKMNCTVSVNITTRSIQEQTCKRKVKL